jgi:hypothetical protein
MLPIVQLRREFQAAVSASDEYAADRLCVACVDLLKVDGASISLLHDRETWGTFGASGEISRRLDELQFTFGEGPCIDAMESSKPVLVSDLRRPEGARWPAFTNAVLGLGVCGVFAMPVKVNGTNVGALDLFRRTPGSLDGEQLNGGLLAADMAGIPVLDLINRARSWPAAGDDVGGDELTSLARVEVYQATGMIMGQLEVDAVEALVRLRAYAFSHDMTASEVAWGVVERRIDFGEEPSGSAAQDGSSR